MSGRKVAKRACDGCKIRKIRCTEGLPCVGCVASGIACTYVKHPATRGPRRLRRSTLQEIAQTQQQWEDLALPTPVEPVVHTDLNAETVFAPSKVAALVLQLCVYRLRCYPVWPIIKVERLVASLQKPQPDIEVFALAYAVAAATIAQIRSKPSEQPGGVTAEMMEAQCLYAKARRNRDQPPDLTTARVPFFLHIYYENIEPGGIRSITCLREAVAIAHMIGLHRESYYQNVEPEEQEIRRRTLWLLFVTERGVSILHKLPVTIKTQINFPSTNDTDEQEVLLAYQQLITMFWSFDQAGVFELLDSQDFDLSKFTSQDVAQTEAFTGFRSQLDQQAIELHRMNDVQAVDILVTRQWMRIILWRLAESHGFFSHGLENAEPLLNDPILIAKELLSTLSRFPNTAIEAHGPGLETKVFEIACTVADALRLSPTEFSQAEHIDHQMARDILAQLQKLLLKNKKLYARVNDRVAFDRKDRGTCQSTSSLQPATADSKSMDFEIERQLQAHGFDFTDPTVSGQSPDTESLSSDQIGRSPQDHTSQTPLQQMSNLTRGDPPHRSPSWPQHIPGLQAGMNLSHITSGGLANHFGQGSTDMDFVFNTFPAGNTTSLGAFEDFVWSEYAMPDHTSPAPNELPASIPEASWPAAKNS